MGDGVGSQSHCDSIFLDSVVDSSLCGHPLIFGLVLGGKLGPNFVPLFFGELGTQILMVP